MAGADPLLLTIRQALEAAIARAGTDMTAMHEPFVSALAACDALEARIWLNRNEAEGLLRSLRALLGPHTRSPFIPLLEARLAGLSAEDADA